jgi:hypothetical protein
MASSPIDQIRDGAVVSPSGTIYITFGEAVVGNPIPNPPPAVSNPRSIPVPKPMHVFPPREALSADPRTRYSPTAPAKNIPAPAPVVNKPTAPAPAPVAYKPSAHVVVKPTASAPVVFKPTAPVVVKSTAPAPVVFKPTAPVVVKSTAPAPVVYKPSAPVVVKPNTSAPVVYKPTAPVVVKPPAPPVVNPLAPVLVKPTVFRPPAAPMVQPTLDLARAIGYDPEKLLVAMDNPSLSLNRKMDGI